LKTRTSEKKGTTPWMDAAAWRVIVSAEAGAAKTADAATAIAPASAAKACRPAAPPRGCEIRM